MAAIPTTQTMTTTDVLPTLVASLADTLSELPDELSAILPPPNGISLLDVKSDLLLSYVQNLSFLALLRLKGTPLKGHPVVDELVKLRALLDKGVKPLEAKLKYRIDKVVSAAVDAETKGTAKPQDESEDSTSDSSDDSEDEAVAESSAPKPSDLAFRPNPASLLLSDAKDKRSRKDEDSTDGIYRPPRIAPTVMPDLERASKRERPVRSHAMDDFVSAELSSAPIAEPSIGSRMQDAGRTVKAAYERKDEDARREYEERNFVRLPKISKKEARENKSKHQGARGRNLGGEDWRAFAGDLDKITDRTAKGGNALEKSRKRKGDEEDAGGIGRAFEGRVRMDKKRKKY